MNTCDIFVPGQSVGSGFSLCSSGFALVLETCRWRNGGIHFPCFTRFSSHGPFTCPSTFRKVPFRHAHSVWIASCLKEHISDVHISRESRVFPHVALSCHTSTPHFSLPLTSHITTFQNDAMLTYGESNFFEDVSCDTPLSGILATITRKNTCPVDVASSRGINFDASIVRDARFGRCTEHAKQIHKSPPAPIEVPDGEIMRIFVYKATRLRCNLVCEVSCA